MAMSGEPGSEDTVLNPSSAAYSCVTQNTLPHFSELDTSHVRRISPSQVVAHLTQMGAVQLGY